MTKYAVLTTFHAAGYQKYASRMIDTFLQNWPSEVDLYVYTEDCIITQSAPNLHVRDLHAVSPEIVAFKQRWGNDPRARGLVATGPADRKGKAPGIGFRWDAIRFSHKAYSVAHCAANCSADVLFWMDADMVCHTPITLDFITSQMPSGTGLAYLGREKKFTECGLYGMNLQDPVTRAWLKEFQLAYDSGRLMTMAEWNDCWVFDETRKEVQAANPAWRQLNWSAGLIKGEGHPLINTAWGAYLDHLKGKRKDTGKSAAKDLIRPRTESYWSSSATS
jgi:hypothetical protein